MSLQHYLQLSLTAGLGPILIRRLIEHAGSPENACNLKPSDLRLIEGIGQAKAHSIHQSLQSASADADLQLHKAQALGARILALDDPDYPPLLQAIQDPPTVLFMLGSLQPRDLNALAIVGSRRCSYYGREQAQRFASLLASAGFTVVSGGARGIDSAAHRGAFQHPQGRTIAVLGSGLDVPYPPENEPLFKEIAQRGALLSEFPFGTPPSAENFPRRNRIVSGLSRGVLVIEADIRSGALITARLANEDHGRPVFALPGRVDSQTSAGAHQLIRDGAILTTCLEDILTGLHPFPDSVRQPSLFDASSPGDPPSPSPNAPPSPSPGTPGEGRGEGFLIPPPTLTDRQRLILQHLDQSPTSVDQLIDRTNLDASAILQDLTFLSLKALIKRIDGQTYALMQSR